MKILLITDSLGKGGKERQILELLKGLQHYPKIDLNLAIFSKEIGFPMIYEMGVPLHILERKPKKDPRVFWRFYKLCQLLKPDLIHSWGSMPTIYALPTAKKLGIKLINAMIQDAPPQMSLLDSRRFRSWLTMPFSDQVVGNSLAGLKSYRAPESKSFCMYNGFDLDRAKPHIPEEEIREKFNIQTPYIVGMVGAFADRKDYFTYIESAKIILQKRKDISFLAIGEGKNRSLCEARVPQELRKYILFTGLQDEVESLVNTFTVGILATNKRVHGEGIANVIMEYMAMGKPVIATDAGGTREIVLHGENGYLIEDQDSQQLAGYILELVDHPEQADRLGQNGKSLLENTFNMEKMVDEHVKLYEKALDVSEISMKQLS
ncbi:MAG: glycosyltransferase [Bacteroidota bacterium]